MLHPPLESAEPSGAQASPAWVGEQHYEYFADVPDGRWYTDVVNTAYLRYVMYGYAGTDLFGPEEPMSRAQVATAMYRIFEKYGARHPEEKVDRTDFPTTDETGFSDVAESDYYTQALNWAVHYKIAFGDAGADTFRPDDPVTREEAAAFIYRFVWWLDYDPDTSYFPVDGNAKNYFSDLWDADLFASFTIVAMYKWGYMTGVPTDNPYLKPEFQPFRNLTRAEAAKIFLLIDSDFGGRPR